MKKSSTKSETSKLALSVNDFILQKLGWICFLGQPDVLGRNHKKVEKDKFKRLMSSYRLTSADHLLFTPPVISFDISNGNNYIESILKSRTYKFLGFNLA